MTRPGAISVIIPVHGGARFLAEALESVAAQTLLPVEVIVIDDGSTDASSAIAENFHARLFRQERRGVSAARNAGIAASSGDFLAFLDADDVWLPHKLETQMRAISDHPATELCTTRFSYFLHPGVTPPPLLDPTTLGVAQPKTCPSSWLAHRDLFLRAGLFPEHIRVAEDIAWLANVRATNATVTALDDCLVSKRIHDTNLSGNFGEIQRQTFRVLRSAIARQSHNETPTR